MIGQRILVRKSVNRIKHLQIDKPIQAACQSYRLLGKCNQADTVDPPFLWSPANCGKESINKLLWPRISNQPWKEVDYFYNWQCSERKKYDSLRRLLVLDKVCNDDTLEKRFDLCSTGFKADGFHSNVQLVLPAVTSNSYNMNKVAGNAGSILENFKQSGPCCCLQRTGQGLKRTSPHNRKQKHFKTLNFVKTGKGCSKEGRNSKAAKKLPRTNELVIERIVDNITEEWPKLFSSKVLLDSSITSEMIFFDNAVLGFKTRGQRLYKLQVWCFKWATKLLWFDRTLQVLQVTKSFEDSTIKIRWLVNGRPRLLYLMYLFGRTPSLRYMDFFSILKVGESEKVDVHHVSKLVPRQTPQKRNILLSILPLLGLSRSDLPDFQEEPVLPSTTDPGS
ncbi:uncharacterized protein LOC135693968 isoform X1 [Rhopilema esculentum]|uniref:uncharacterized protein LOC135693968 isoform X1 n=1 Tax=Rhopilema esculentum TaxID=499914 RepID=UPI0031DF4A61